MPRLHDPARIRAHPAAGARDEITQRHRAHAHPLHAFQHQHPIALAHPEGDGAMALLTAGGQRIIREPKSLAEHSSTSPSDPIADRGVRLRAFLVIALAPDRAAHPPLEASPPPRRPWPARPTT